MKQIEDITPELQARIRLLAERFGSSPADIIADALENGHSLAWQERYLEKVAKGIAAADRGEFANDDDMQRVRNKYRPA